MRDAAAPGPSIPSEAGPAQRAWRFGLYELHPARGLLRAGQAVPLGGRALQLLGVLVQAQGALVDKQALMRAAWPRQVVVENALHQHLRALRRALGEEAALVQNVSGRGWRLAAMVQAVPVEPMLPAPQPPLPSPPWPLVGRQTLLLALAERVSPGRCVSLLGPAGVGKTRVALAHARACAERGELVAWCDLAPLARAQDLPQAIARALGLQAQGSEDALAVAARTLRDSALLLVLDNCEHLRDECAAAAQLLLASCAGLAVLATSQRPLGLPAEWRLPVEPLPLPPEGACSPAVLAAAPALQLLQARVQAAGGQPAGEEDLPLAAALCARLDGLPLALTLAGPRVATLGWAATLESLAMHHKLLVAGAAAAQPRHRSLDAAMAWSCELLPPALQRDWQALSVFSGSWTLGGAQAVLGADTARPGRAAPAAAAVLAELAERSLLHALPGSQPQRFSMHAAQRSHARARLQRSPAAARVALLHGAHVAEQALQALADWEQTPDERWRQRYAADLDDLLAAAQAALQRADAPLARRLVGAGIVFWRALGAVNSLREWLAHPLLAWTSQPAADPAQAQVQLARALALLDESSPNAQLEFEARRAVAAADTSLDATAQAQARLCLASAAARQGATELQAQAVAQATALLQARPAGRTWGWCCSAQAWALQLQGDLPGARAAVLQALSAWRRCGAVMDAAQALTHLADLQLALGEVDAALASGWQALACFEGHRFRQQRGRVLANLGAAQMRAAQPQAARPLLQEAVRQLQGLDYSYWVCDHLAGLAMAEGQPRRAAQLLGHADAGYARHRGGRRLHNEARVHAQVMAWLQQQLSREALAAALHEGAAADESELLPD